MKQMKNKNKSIKESKFIFNSADLLYHKFHKMSLNRDG